jgi:dipeptidyl-peptidase-4
MKKLQLVFLLFFVWNTLFVAAQDKKLTETDAAWMNAALFPERIQQLKWFGNTDYYQHFEKDTLWLTEAKSEKRKVHLTLNGLNTLAAKHEFDSLKRFPAINWLDDGSGWFFDQNKLFQLTADFGKLNHITTYPKEAENKSVFTPDLHTAYTITNNLYLAVGDEHIQLTKEPEGVVSGQSVHRNEFGISGGIFWSKDGSKLAFYQMDERMVTNYPLVDTEERIATLKNEPYPMAGMKSHEVKLLIYDLNSKNTITIQTGEPAEQYLTAVSWHPLGDKIYIGILNREQNHLKFNAYQTSDGSMINTLFEEKDPQYVEPQFPAFFLPNNADQFIWLSERDGFRHMYLYSTEGELIKQLTNGEWMITSEPVFDQSGKNIYFSSTAESPLERHFYKLNLKNDKTTHLTPVAGVHSVSVSKSGKYLIDSYSNLETSRKIMLADGNGKSIRTLLESKDPLKDYQLGKTQILELEAEDGTTLFARMITPPNLDSTKKYPVIVYVYGGPHAQLITNSWLGGANFYLNYLAQQGYVVFTLDNRGSANRGAEFEQIIHRQLGKVERQDQMTGIEFLKSLPFVDPDRIGVDGWSYGGFMSIGLKLHHPEIFKVAVAGGPVTDWKYYEIMYGERYMDTPDENPEGYESANLIKKVNQLDGKLLIIHGTSDPVVVWQHSLAFLKAAVDEGKLLDYFVYPGHEHNVRGKDRAHLIKMISTYFNENL